MSSRIFQNYAREIKKETGIDCFSSSRTDAHAIARSILNQAYMQSRPKVKLREIKEYYADNGKPMNHATIMHSLNSFKMYFDLPVKKQKRELGKTVKDVYYKLLLFYNGNQRKRLRITEKIALLWPEQADEVNNIIDQYAEQNIRNYIQDNAE